MPCDHRFFDLLIPQQTNLQFLFIGTFNPCWNAANGNDADYFYGRATNLFWCICPHALQKTCLIDKTVTEWVQFCVDNNVALTDLIRCVNNANRDNPDHRYDLTLGFQDKNLEKKVYGEYLYDFDFNTDQILEIINNNVSSLKGVFFTRKTASEIPRIWSQWIVVTNHCTNLNIYSSALSTPSIRGGAIRDKIFEWRQEIKNSLAN